MTIVLRPMKREDIRSGLRLSTLAGWNQTESDWNLFFDAGGAGCFTVTVQDRVIGTVTCIKYEAKIAWIGMVLVDPTYRRQGIGTMLVKAAIDRCQATVENIFLDATPQGKLMYDRLGFKDIQTIYRLGYENGNHQATIKADCTSLTDEIQNDFLKLDETVFGAGRKNILSFLYSQHPHLAFGYFKDGQMAGYCLGREGRQFSHIGPVQASDDSSAHSLVLAALERARKPGIILDVPDNNPTWLNWLKSIGFYVSRSFVRMGLGQCKVEQHFENQYAVAGPEIG